jgi:hypothetical protein
MKSIKKTSVLVLLLVSAFIFTACDDSGDSDNDSETAPSIYGSWTTTNQVKLAVNGNRSQTLNTGSKLVLNEDKTFSLNFNSGDFCWPYSSGGGSCAPIKDTFTGSFSFTSDTVFTFSFVNNSVTYEYTVTYSELTSTSVTLDCSVVTIYNGTSVTNTCTFSCERE